jgi:hypothetical protein
MSTRDPKANSPYREVVRYRLVNEFDDLLWNVITGPGRPATWGRPTPGIDPQRPPANDCLGELKKRCHYGLSVS